MEKGNDKKDGKEQLISLLKEELINIVSKEFGDLKKEKVFDFISLDLKDKDLYFSDLEFNLVKSFLRDLSFKLSVL